MAWTREWKREGEAEEDARDGVREETMTRKGCEEKRAGEEGDVVADAALPLDSRRDARMRRRIVSEANRRAAYAPDTEREWNGQLPPRR